MTDPISGPRIAARSGTTKHLVIFLHGYGANGDDLIDIGHHWGALLPDTAFVSPHAPFPCQGAPFGREWFPLRLFNTEELWQGANMVAPHLNAFIDSELRYFNLQEPQVALVGFSQGTMMALHVGLRRLQTLAGIVGFSGQLCLDSQAGIESLKKQIKTAPPVFLSHGDQDMVVPVASLEAAQKALTDVAVPCQTYIAPGLGHGIDQEGLRLAGLFLKKVFGYS